MMTPNIRITFIAVILIFYSATNAFAVPSVTIPPSDSETYSVQGSNMDGVAGIQLDIAYDTTSLSTPTVTQGALVAGAMLAANTSRPGFIKIAIISTRPFSGSGQIAAITFASKTGSGGITSITTSMIDKNGSPVVSSANNSTNGPAQAGTITTPGVPFSQPSQQTSSSSTTTTTASSAASATTPVHLGAVSLPTDQQQRIDTSPAVPPIAGEPPVAKIEEQTQPSVKPSVDAKPEETAQYVVFKGILDRFKQYSGSKKLSAMVALFEIKVAQTIRQEPIILLSNGQSKATLTVDIPTRITSSPNFAANGGTVVSFKQDKHSKGRWTVVVLPEAGAIRVTVTIIAGAEEFEFPLTVAPQAKTALTLDESGWDRFLKEVGTEKTPMHDFNNDGVRDYIDEYIFVSNYLVRKTIPEKPAATSKKSEKISSLDGTK